VATLTQRKVEYLGKRGGEGNGVVRTYPEASGQSFKAGQFVYLASGKVTVCADDAVTILGIALQDASGTADTSIQVQVLDDTDEFAICVYNATAASAITAIASVGLKGPLQVDSNKCYFDNTDQTTPSMVVQGIYLPAGEAVGDVYGRYKASLLSAVCQTLIGA
jgi:hypothetical protein